MTDLLQKVIFWKLFKINYVNCLVNRQVLVECKYIIMFNFIIVWYNVTIIYKKNMNGNQEGSADMI